MSYASELTHIGRDFFSGNSYVYRQDVGPQAGGKTLYFCVPKLFTIPILLVLDIILGYNISSFDISGVLLIFVGVYVLLHNNTAGKRGAGLILIAAVIAAATTALYKYDISKYNSVAAEQLIVCSVILVYLWVAGRVMKKPVKLKLLFHRVTGAQAISAGLSTVLISLALYIATSRFAFGNYDCCSRIARLNIFSESGSAYRTIGSWTNIRASLISSSYFLIASTK